MTLEYALSLKIGETVAFPGEDEVKWEIVDILTEGDPPESVTLSLLFEEQNEIIRISSKSWKRI